ncbi:MAG: hypothetical protein LKJ65_03715, partial [Lactobacillus sp.]|nr:hypothetical protein [Lactobacillus sp.]
MTVQPLIDCYLAVPAGEAEGRGGPAAKQLAHEETAQQAAPGLTGGNGKTALSAQRDAGLPLRLETAFWLQ